MLETATNEVTNRSSNRSFGLVMMAFFLLLGVGPLLAGKPVLRWPFAVSSTFLILALALPAALAPLNRLWFQLGLLLHKVVSPIVLGVIFYLVITPFALVMRAFGADPMRRKFDRGTDSYWIERQPPGPQPESFRDQF